MPQIPKRIFEQMFVKVESAVCKTTAFVEVWNSKGSSTGNASVWALDLALQHGWGARMLGDRDEKIVVGHYVSREFSKPKDPMTVEIKDRSVRRNSEWNKVVIPRLFPCPAHWRQACTFALLHGHIECVLLYICSRVRHIGARRVLSRSYVDT